jgi:hypothetical protein
MPKNKMKKLGDLLESNTGYSAREAHSLGKSPGEVFDFLELLKAWPEMVGVALAKHTIPLKLTGQVLTIVTNHPAFSEQTTYMEKLLRDKITSSFPQLGIIKALKFYVNPNVFMEKEKLVATVVKKKDAAKSWHPFSPEYRRFRQEAESQYSFVDDIEMKEALISLYLQLQYANQL